MQEAKSAWQRRLFQEVEVSALADALKRFVENTHRSSALNWDSNALRENGEHSSAQRTISVTGKPCARCTHHGLLEAQRRVNRRDVTPRLHFRRGDGGDHNARKTFS